MTFSYSKISTFKQCPYKYKLIYIDKLAKTEVNEALIKGSKIHSLLENYETLDSNAEYADIVLNFARSAIGNDILSKQSTREHCVKFDKDLNANDNLSKDETYLIGYIDRINAYTETTPQGETISKIDLIDFKTGKYKDPRFQDYEQLGIYGLYMFSKYPKLESLKLRYVYVEHSKENSKTMTKEEVPVKKQLLKNDLHEIENTQNFEKKPHRLCDWCEFKSFCKPNK